MSWTGHSLSYEKKLFKLDYSAKYMDPFNERELLEYMKSIALSLRNIDRKIDDMTMSLREIAASQLDEGGDEEDEVAIEQEEAKE